MAKKKKLKKYGNGGTSNTDTTVGDQYYWATLNKDRANVPAALSSLFSKGDYPLQHYTDAVVPENNALDAYGTFNLQRHFNTTYGMRKQMKEKSNYKNGGKLAFCRDGGEIDFTYIFSKQLGTADKTQKVMRDLGGRMPSDYLHVVSGPDHPVNGSQGGAQFDSSMRPVDNSTLKFNGATAGNRSANRVEPQPTAVAFLENEETFINPKYNKGILPFGVDPIAKNTADRLFTSIEAENESLRMSKENKKMARYGGKMRMYDDGGINIDGLYQEPTQISLQDPQLQPAGATKMPTGGEGLGGLGIATNALTSLTGAATGFANMASQLKEDRSNPNVSDTTRRTNAATTGLNAAGEAIGAIPVVGQFGKAALGAVSAITGIFGAKSAKKDAWKEAYSNLPMAVTQNTAGNQIQGYAEGGPFNTNGTYEPADMQEYYKNMRTLSFDPNSLTGPMSDREFRRLQETQNQPGVASTGLFSKKPTNFDRRPMPFTTDYSKPGVPESFKTAPRNPVVQPDQFGLTTGDKLLLGSMAPATLFNAANFATGYDKEKAILNPEANKVKSLMDQKIDFQAMLNESRAERNRTEGFVNRSTDNQAVRRANLMQIGANSARVNSGINLQGQQAQNALDTSRAQMLDQLGRETMQAKETSRELTARNKGQWLNFGAAAAENVGEGLSRTGTAMNTREMNNLKLGILNSLPGNYSTSKEQILKAMEGMSPEQLIAFNAYAESVTKK